MRDATEMGVLSRGLSGKNKNQKTSPANAGDASSIPGWGMIPCRRKWQPTSVFLSGKSHGQRSLADYGPWHHKSQTHLTKPPPPATWESNREPAVKKKKVKM